MRSTSAPEPATQLWELSSPDDIFAGPTLTAAVAAATRARGADVHITAARSVREGISGLVGKQRYEVLTSPTAGAVAAPTLAVVPDSVELDLPEAESFALMVQDAIDRVQVTEAVLPEIETFEVQVPAQRAAKTSTRKATTTAAAVKAPKTAPAARKAEPLMPVPSAHGWSHERLTRMGVPKKVVDAITVDDSATDLTWAGALADAITLFVALPSELDEDSLAVIDAAGPAGALMLLKGAVMGLRPRHLTINGVARPATAAEIALAIRELVR